jgi:hypothetical protein
MRAKELKRCLISQSKVFSGLDESKADKLSLEPILSCFHSLNKSQKVLALSRVVFTTRMRAKELKRCLSSQSQVFSGLDESKKADKPILEPILGCFHGLDKRQKVLTLSQVVFTTRMRAKELKRCLSSQSQVFSGLNESKKADKPTRTYPRLFSWPGWEPDSARPIPELFNPDESKRAEKMFELAILSLFRLR